MIAKAATELAQRDGAADTPKAFPRRAASMVATLFGLNGGPRSLRYGSFSTVWRCADGAEPLSKLAASAASQCA